VESAILTPKWKGPGSGLTFWVRSDFLCDSELGGQNAASVCPVWAQITYLSCFNMIVGKSMLKNKRPQIARECMSSYVGYLRKQRITAHVIVEHVSNMKSKHRKQLTTT